MDAGYLAMILSSKSVLAHKVPCSNLPPPMVTILFQDGVAMLGACVHLITQNSRQPMDWGEDLIQIESPVLFHWGGLNEKAIFIFFHARDHQRGWILRPDSDSDSSSVKFAVSDHADKGKEAQNPSQGL